MTGHVYLYTLTRSLFSVLVTIWDHGEQDVSGVKGDSHCYVTTRQTKENKRTSAAQRNGVEREKERGIRMKSITPVLVSMAANGEVVRTRGLRALSHSGAVRLSDNVITW